jgi:hypothetical protein
MTRVPAEWFRQQRPMWISPLKLREYYADFLVPEEIEDTQRANCIELSLAVISGRS